MKKEKIKIATVPEKEKEQSVKEQLENALRAAGTSPEAFEILSGEPFVLYNLNNPNMALACYVAVSKLNGMMFLFASQTIEKIESSLVKC